MRIPDNVGAKKVDDAVSDGSPIAQTVDLIAKNAIKAGATDIHIEPRESFVVIRYRVDGILRVANKLPYKVLRPLIQRIKMLAMLNIDEQRAPQEGHYNIEIEDGTYNLRVSILPIVDGEKIVMRIFNDSSPARTLEELGFWGDGLQRLQRAMVQPSGMLLISGPDGSGKSTTLFSILSLLATPNVTIATVEDPIKYRLPGAHQTQIQSVGGMSFGSGLRAVMRQDPNIIMVGELPDSDTTERAVQAAHSGHLVCSTLHTDNAASCLPRLLHMGVKPFLIASTLRAVVGQRLVRRLCASCREAIKVDDAVLQQLRDSFQLDTPDRNKEIHELETAALAAAIGKTGAHDVHHLSSTPSGITRVWRANIDGCSSCDHSGYKGRVGIYEVLTISEAIQKQLVTDASSQTLEQLAIHEGMIPIRLDGLIKSLRGETTIEEVLRAVPN